MQKKVADQREVSDPMENLFKVSLRPRQMHTREICVHFLGGHRHLMTSSHQAQTPGSPHSQEDLKTEPTSHPCSLYYPTESGRDTKPNKPNQNQLKVRKTICFQDQFFTYLPLEERTSQSLVASIKCRWP